MKKITLVMLLALCGITFFGACSKDSDDPKEQPTDYAQVIKGVYKGDLSITDQTIPNVTINVVYASVNKVTMKMNQVVMNIPIDISCDAPVTYSNNTYYASGTTTFGAFPVNIDAEFDAKGAAKMTIEVVMGGSMVIDFAGNKQ